MWGCGVHLLRCRCCVLLPDRRCTRDPGSVTYAWTNMEQPVHGNPFMTVNMEEVEGIYWQTALPTASISSPCQRCTRCWPSLNHSTYSGDFCNITFKYFLKAFHFSHIFRLNIYVQINLNRFSIQFFFIPTQYRLSTNAGRQIWVTGQWW